MIKYLAILLLIPSLAWSGEYMDVALQINSLSELPMIEDAEGKFHIKPDLNPIPINPEDVPQIIRLRARPETIASLIEDLAPSVTVLKVTPSNGTKYEHGTDDEGKPIYKYKKLNKLIEEDPASYALYLQYNPSFSEFMQDKNGIDLLFDEPELDADGKEIKIDKLDELGKIVYELDANSKKIKDADGKDVTVKETKMIEVKKDNPRFGSFPGPGGFM